MNRFGRAESLGGGLLTSLTSAVAAEVPVLTAVRAPYDVTWAQFHGGLGCELHLNRPDSPYLGTRWAQRGLGDLMSWDRTRKPRKETATAGRDLSIARVPIADCRVKDYEASLLRTREMVRNLACALARQAAREDHAAERASNKATILGDYATVARRTQRDPHRVSRDGN